LRGSTASGRYLSDQLIELEVAERPWPDSGGWRFATRKGIFGEDRVGGPVTIAEIEAVAEPLGCVVGDLIGPSSAHGYLPFRSSGLLWVATTQ
jgi:hypothetical protein